METPPSPSDQIHLFGTADSKLDKAQAVKRWTKILFEGLWLNMNRPTIGEAEAEARLRKQMETLFDLDDHYKLSHSLTGTEKLGFLDVLMISFVKRATGVWRASDICSMTEPPLDFPNVSRVIQSITEQFKVSPEPMDKKEKGLLDNISMLSSSKDFLDAVRANDIERCSAILKDKPRAINSFDPKDKNRGAAHLAA
mmetsp:Transcript_29553/g.45038  ORF Transcript_29553/g.45038 Transcript_29553/m.45038 type:complete len:197 (+) Transcript_29553:527-1117(+)